MKNIIGKRFSTFTIIRKTDEISPKHGFLWEYRCDCGTTIIGPIRNIINGRKKSCGCKNPMRLIDLTGRKIGKLTVISPNGKRISKGGHVTHFWNCKCDCGNDAIVSSKHLRRNAIKSCGCSHHRVRHQHPSWKGYGEIWGNYFSSIKSGANGKSRGRGLEFSISIEYIWDLFLKQNRKCALTGCELIFDTKRTNKQTASLDRIDSSKGYIEGNVQWVHKDINRIKSTFSQDKFIQMCKDVINWNSSNKT